jgi:outer membrane protein TolC
MIYRIGKPLPLLLAILMCGCVQFEPRPIDPEVSASGFEARGLGDPGLKAFIEKNLGHAVTPWPLASWKPEELTLVALYYHPDMDLARAKWGTARATTGTAGESPNPTISAVPGYNTSNSNPSPWLGVLNFDIPIETAGKRGYRVAQAQNNAEAARANLFATAWQVRSRVQRTILDFVSTRKNVALLKQQQAAQEQVVKLLELQQPNGGVPPTLVTQARIALRGVRLSALEAQRQHLEAQAALADALGLTVAAVQNVQIDRPLSDQLPQAVSTAEARRRAVTARSDVLAALKDYEASQSALQLEIAKQYPDLHIGPGYEYDQGDNKWNLGVGLTLPVFNQNRGAIAEAQSRRTEAAVRFMTVQAKVLNDIDRATLVYEAARLKLEAARELLADVQKQRRAAQASFDAGDSGKLELAAAQLELLVNEQASVEATVKAHQALLAVEEALQQPLGVPDSALTESPERSPANQEKRPQ